MLKKDIKSLCDTLIFDHKLIPDNRKVHLNQLALTIQKQIKTSGKSYIIVICTHNSRRSQLGELWLHIGALYFSLPIHSFSGGSEVTALNHRIVKALEIAEFTITEKTSGNNPQYSISLKEGTSQTDKLYFSKIYNDTQNPQSDFIALIVCDNADQSCPIISGADHRHFIPYIDPGYSDDSDSEAEVYLEKVYEIGREMLFMLELISLEASV